MLASMTTVSLLGFMGIVLEQHGNTEWCRWRRSFIHGFLCAVYDSYILQAGYRLCQVLFLIPIELIFGVGSISPVLLRGDVIYLSLEYLRKITNNNHSTQDTRDLIVIRRLLLMLSVLIFLGLPSIIFLSIFMVTGYLISVTYRVGWLSVSFSLVFLVYMLIQLTNPLKKL